MGPGPAAVNALVAAIRESLAARADPERAATQQAYMHSRLPFYGLAMPQLRALVAGLCRGHRLPDRGRWQRTIRELWDGATHREEWYAALVVARFRPYAAWVVEPAALPLWERLIRAGAWWDVGDEITEHLVAPSLAARPVAVTAELRRWSADPDRWIRRAAILAQNRRKAATDVGLLEYCLAGSLDDRDFFARKAIGWALREYSKTDPGWVQAYVAEHATVLSGLSVREALRLVR